MNSKMTKSSFLKTYGSLSVPVIVLTTFGWFHFKTGPLSDGCPGKFTRIYSIVILFITEALIINYIVNFIPSISMNGEDLLYSIGVIFFIFLLIFMPATFSLNYSKIRNNSNIIMDVSEAKLNKLSLSCIIYMLLCGTLALASLTFCWYIYFLAIKNAALSEQYDVQSLVAKYNVSSFLGSKAYFEPIVDALFFTSIFVAIVITSLLVSFICLHIGNEFDACSKELSHCLRKNNIESGSNLPELKNRFHSLERLVESVNNHFSFYIGYNILVSLFVICALCYAVTLVLRDDELPNEIIPGMMTPIAIMSSNVFLLTIPVSYLHTKVRTCFTFTKPNNSAEIWFTLIVYLLIHEKWAIDIKRRH